MQKRAHNLPPAPAREPGLRDALAAILDLARRAGQPGTDAASVAGEIAAHAERALAGAGRWYDEDLARVGHRMLLAADHSQRRRLPLALRFDPDAQHGERWHAVIGDAGGSAMQLHAALGRVLEASDPVYPAGDAWRYRLDDGGDSQDFRTERDARMAHQRYVCGFAGEAL